MLLLAENRRKWFVHKDIMEGAAEQIPVSHQDKAQISLGFALRTICIIICPEIACVPRYRRLHAPLICNLFLQSSDTEISNILENSCSANEPRFWSTFSHLPSCNLGLSIFSHSWKKHPIVSLFCCGSEESQVWPAAVKAQPEQSSWREDKSHCGPWSFPFHGTEETHKN